jgi:hypothetical protein
VHTPDLYDGRTFDDLDEGVAHAGEIGFGEVIARGVRAADDLPAEIVYAGFSLGAVPAQKLAQTRTGARGALLFHACAPTSAFGPSWPADVPVQIHAMEADPWFVDDVRKGHKVLVYGASGAAGTYAVQLAKYMGAEVTGVSSGANLELVRSLGADKAIDYTKADFTKNGELYDVIFDAVGKTSKSNCKNALAPNGTYVSINQGNPWPRVEDLVLLMGLVKTKQIRSVIDRRYSLEQIPEAHRYVEKGHKKGNVVVTVS